MRKRGDGRLPAGGISNTAPVSILIMRTNYASIIFARIYI